MRSRRALLLLIVLISCVGCDHAAKQIAHDSLGDAQRVSLFSDVLRLELTHNNGAFLSLGSTLPKPVRSVLFVVLVPMVLIAVSVLVLRSTAVTSWTVLAIGLVVGGGVANWLDRVMNAGLVTDFLLLRFGGLRTGVFNLADVFIVIGVGLLVISHWRQRGVEDSVSV